MDKPYDSLDQHFNLPHIRSIGTDRPVQWLRMGWADMRDNLGASLSYGVILAAIVMVMLQEMRELSEYRMLIFGLVMIFMMIWRPQGLLPMQRPHLELKR